MVFYFIGGPSLSVTQTKLVGPSGITQHIALASWMITITGFRLGLSPGLPAPLLPPSTCLCAHDCDTVPVGSAPQPDMEGGGAPSSLSCPGPGLPPGTTLTCLEDLVAQGEAGTLPGVVGGELDEEHGARGDDGGWSDVPTVLPQEVCRLTVPIPDLDEVIPR